VSVTVSSDGALVAESDPRQGVQLYDAETMAPVPFGDDTPTSVIRFSPDGQVLAAAVNHWQESGGERIVPLPVRLYDVRGMKFSDRQLGGWPAGSTVDYRMDFSRDGRRLAAGVMLWDGDANDWRRAGSVMVWDVRRPEVPVFEAAVPDEAIVALSPDGRRVFTATLRERTLRVYDVDTGRLLLSAEPTFLGSYGVSDLEVSPDGSTLAVGAGDKVHLLDTRTLAPRAAALRGHAGTKVEYSHDGSILVSTSAAGGVMVWDADSGAELHRLVGHSGEIGDAVFAPDDSTLYTTDSDEVMTWDVTGKDALLPAGQGTAPVGGQLDLSVPAPNGRTIARVAGQELWFVHDRDGRETSPSTTDRAVWFHGWSPDSTRFFTVGPGVLTLWDPNTGRLVGERLYTEGYGVVAALSSDGDRVYVHDRFGNLETLDPATLQPLHDTVGVADITALVSHPTEDTILGLVSDGSIVRADPETGHLLATESLDLDYEFGEYLGGAVSPDGSLLALHLPQGGMRLLDTDTLEWVGEQSPIEVGENISFAPGGDQLASVTAGWIRLWDGRTGVYQAGIPLPEPTADADVSYLPDGSGLLVSTLDGRTWTVDTRTTAWVERACRIAGRNLTQSEWKQFFPNRPYEVTCPQWPAGE
jgi:WD40 repeat protein